MKLTIVTGSHRKNSESQRIADYLVEHHCQGFSDVHQHYLAHMDLPMWDESIWEGDQAWAKRLAPLQKQWLESDAMIVVTPDWAGMVPPMLKNYMLLSNQSQLRHTPALIVSVSSGLGGAYPVNELRSSSYKNNKLCYIPEHLIFRHCEGLFTGENPDLDEELAARTQFSINLLTAYAGALKGVRGSGLPFDDYSFGM